MKKNISIAAFLTIISLSSGLMAHSLTSRLRLMIAGAVGLLGSTGTALYVGANRATNPDRKRVLQSVGKIAGGTALCISGAALTPYSWLSRTLLISGFASDSPFLMGIACPAGGLMCIGGAWIYQASRDLFTHTKTDTSKTIENEPVNIQS